MKTTYIILILGLLLFATLDRCFADFGVEDVSKVQAKKMGLAIRTEKNGDAGIEVFLEFKANGQFAKFDRVELLIVEGNRHVVTAPLQVSHPRPGNVAVRYSADPAYLPKSMLWIYVYNEPLGGTIYQLKIKDFVEPRSDTRTSPPSSVATPEK